jgi:hypothetical protein
MQGKIVRDYRNQTIDKLRGNILRDAQVNKDNIGLKHIVRVFFLDHK